MCTLAQFPELGFIRTHGCMDQEGTLSVVSLLLGRAKEPGIVFSSPPLPFSSSPHLELQMLNLFSYFLSRNTLFQLANRFFS